MPDPNYPLLFGFSDLIAGNGFFASVALQGRALLVNEGDGFWMYGVNPGGVAGGGITHGEAQAQFRQSYRSVLFDMAAMTPDFEQFELRVKEFYSETNELTLQEWDAAVAEVRKGNIEADWLPKRAADSRVGVEVTRLTHPNPSLNGLDQVGLADGLPRAA